MLSMFRSLISLLNRVSVIILVLNHRKKMKPFAQHLTPNNFYMCLCIYENPTNVLLLVISCGNYFHMLAVPHTSLSSVYLQANSRPESCPAGTRQLPAEGERQSHAAGAAKQSPLTAGLLTLCKASSDNFEMFPAYSDNLGRGAGGEEPTRCISTFNFPQSVVCKHTASQSKHEVMHRRG